MAPISMTTTAIDVTSFIGRAASFGDRALPIAEFVAGFIPGLAPAITAIRIAEPIIARIAQAAPLATKAIKDGGPIIAALQGSGPDVVSDLKQLYAIAVNADPARPETAMTAADVTTEQVASFAPHVFGLQKLQPQDPLFSRFDNRG